MLYCCLEYGKVSSMAKLCFKYGTVKSGKGEELKFLKRRFLKCSIPILVMAPVAFHKTEISKYDYLIGKEENIFKTIKGQFAYVNCIFIEDAHLLEAKHIDQLLQVVEMLHIAVVCYGLRTDFRMNGFAGASRLLEVAQVIQEVKSVCECGKKAIFSVRKIDGKVTFCGDKVVTNEHISYDAICPSCYYRKLLHYKKLKESGSI